MRSRWAVFLIAAFLLMGAARLATAQEQVIYSFLSESSGYNPNGPMAMDSHGNLYGTLAGGIFELSPPSEPGGKWTEQVLIDAASQPGVHVPERGLLFDAKGNLYGVSTNEGQVEGEYITGYIAEVSPPSTPGGTWTSQVLYLFPSNASTDCEAPQSYLTIDSKGNLYGTCINGGANGIGGVYELSPPSEPGGKWTEQLLHSYAQDGVDGNLPDSKAGLTFDAHGNLFGTTTAGGTYGDGVVYELSPGAGGEWTETIVYTFNHNTGGPNTPYAAVIFDRKGNLYTTTYNGGISPTGGGGGGGAVIELSPPANQGSEWTMTQLYTFSGKSDGSSPTAAVLFDAAGDLWGTTFHGGPYYVNTKANTDGVLFELIPQSGSGGWKEVVHHFFGAPGDVLAVTWPMIMDRKGNLYGSGSGGSNNCGNGFCGGVFEYTPAASALELSFSPAAGTYDKAQPVTILASAGGADIYYTTDGTAPTASSTLYKGPIDVTENTTIEAIAIDGAETSAVAEAAYVIETAAPTITPDGGTFTKAQTVTLKDAAAGAAIYYTTNGSTPTDTSTKYSKPFPVSKNTTVKAIAVAPDHGASGVVSATFTIN